jgi:hypothetical protein
MAGNAFRKTETTFSLAGTKERTARDLSGVVKEDLETIRSYFDYDLKIIDEDLEVDAFAGSAI